MATPTPGAHRRSSRPFSTKRSSNLMRRVTKSMPVVTLHRSLAYKRVLQGHMDNLPPVNTRVIRIFLSSTFSDMACERNILMKEVYPRLKDYCRDKYGMEFQVIDMRWGVRSESQLDHKGPTLCFQEVINSQSISMGPSFILILGQRYGNHPPPTTISAEEFQMIIEALQKLGKPTGVLNEWYRRDENNIPPVYILKPIIEEANMGNAEEVQNAKEIWYSVETNILSLLNDATEFLAKAGKFDEEKLKQYQASVTEKEIRLGIFNSNTSAYSLVFIREIEDLINHLNHSKIVKFLDIKEEVTDGQMQNAVDDNLLKLIDDLKDRHVKENIPQQNIHKYTVHWKDGISEDNHRDYLERFADDFYQKTSLMIDKSVRERSQFANDEVYTEVLQHSDTCVRYVRQFQGRQEIINQIKEYVQNDSKNPFVVHGASGSGKTSILGKAACESLNWFPEHLRDSCIIILRFLGTSPASSNIRNTLQSVCGQLATFLGEEEVEHLKTLDDFKEIVKFFYSLLEDLSQTCPILVFLDSLDQLDSTSGAYHLTWLRKELPSNVKLIVSTLPEIFGILDTLRSKLPDPKCYAEVTPLEHKLCYSILKSLLNESSRDLTENQWKIVEESFEKCSLPIFVRLVFYQVLDWKSYQTDNLKLEDSVRGAIFQLFRNLETKYGKVLTSHALAYITASRNGLSESEIEDLLSLDDDVLREVFEFHLPPLTRIPPMCWARLRQDVGSYLVEREADNTRILFWYHRQFIEVAREYFLGDEAFKNVIHSRMADYFLGTWGGGKEKVFYFPERLIRKLKLPKCRGEDRMVPSQPFVLEGYDNNIRYNLRKVNELPWHLTHSGRIEEFYDYVVFNFLFLLTKLQGTSRFHLLEDLRLPSEYGIECIKEADYIYNAIRLAAYSLVADPSNLVVDLLGRLFKYEEDNPRIHLLLQQCREVGAEYCCLLPMCQSFPSGSDALSTMFDVGLSMGIVLAKGLIAVISLVNTEVELYDVEGNLIKSYKFDFNIFLGIKFLLRHVPLRRAQYNLVVFGPMTLHFLKELEKKEKKKQKEIEKEFSELEKKEAQENGVDTNNDDNSKEEKEEEDEVKEEAEEEAEEEEEEEDESKRPIDVISINFDTGEQNHIWRLKGKERSSVALDDVDFCGEKYFVTIPKKYLTDMRVYSIEEKKEIFSVLGVQLWASNITNDEELLFWTKKEPENPSFTFSVREMGTGNQYTHMSHLDSSWTPLWSAYFKDELNIVWVKDNDKRNPLIQVFSVDKLRGSDDETRFDIIHEEQLTGCEFWKPILGIKGSGNHEMMRNCFVSTDMTHCVFTYNNRDHIPGFIYDRLTRKTVPLDCSMLTVEDMKVYSKSWSDGTQAYFPSNKKCLITTGTKIMMLIWSLANGQLLRIIKFGTAEALLGGEIDGRFVLFHFPDESQGDTEKMFIMAKFYNIDAISEEDEMLKAGTDSKTIMPIYKVKSAGGGHLFVSTKSPNIFAYDHPKDGIIYDLQSHEVLYRGGMPTEINDENKESLPEAFYTYVQKERDISSPIKEKVKFNYMYENKVVENGETTEDKENDDEEKLIPTSGGLCRYGSVRYVDTTITRQNGSARAWYESFKMKDGTKLKFGSIDKSGFYDKEAKLFFALSGSRALYLYKSPNDFTKVGLEYDAEILLKDWREKEGIPEEETPSFREAHLSRRPSHPGQALVMKTADKKWVDQTKIGKLLYWPGYLIAVDYADYDEESEEKMKTHPYPIFDCGPYLLFFDDGIHVLTYRLHVYDFTTGEKIKEIVPDSPDFLFTNFMFSMDEKYVFGFTVRRPYPVEFEIEETIDEEETIAEDPPRNIQVYRIADGRRMANYSFEVDPIDIMLANHDRNLIVAVHNEELYLFNLAFYEERPCTTSVRQRTQTGKIKERCLSRGPKTSYLPNLNLMPMLSEALLKLVDLRPLDPIAYLSEYIRQKELDRQRERAIEDGH